MGLNLHLLNYNKNKNGIDLFVNYIKLLQVSNIEQSQNLT